MLHLLLRPSRVKLPTSKVELQNMQEKVSFELFVPVVQHQ